MKESISKILLLLSCYALMCVVLKKTNLLQSMQGTSDSSNTGNGSSSSSQTTSANKYSVMEIDNIASDLARDSRCIPYDHYENWKKAASFNDDEWATFEQLFATYRKQGFQKVWKGMIKNKTGTGNSKWDSFRYGITKRIK